MKIRYTKDAIRFLQGQPKKLVGRIRAAFAKLTLDPPVGDIAVMKGYSDGRKRLRVGSWRVVFRYTDDGRVEVLLIIDIGSRGDIYK